MQSREVCERLQGVLCFPDGWMRPTTEEEQAETGQRIEEMRYLRMTCIVEITFLLHNVLHCTEQFREAIQISDLLVVQDLCGEFSKDDMRKLLDKIAESSIAVMDTAGADAFGYPKKQN